MSPELDAPVVLITGATGPLGQAIARRFAREVSGSGVTANLVLISKLDAAYERETAPSTKNASWATPEEVAETIVFLASPAAAALNGARIPLYGRS